jgi:alanyl aminopeptidase
MRSFALVALGFVAACPAPEPPVAPQPPPPPPVVVVQPPPAPIPPAPGDEAPKLRLPRLFVPASYAARLTIDPAKPTFAGSITITGEITVATSVIWLHGRHLTIKKATATGTTNVPIDLHVTPRGEDLLELQTDAALPPGAWQLALDYSGEIDAINTTGAFVESVGGAPYVFTQFEAVYARRVFPCLDEPDSKVPWQLTLDVPKGLVAVANTPIAQESEAGAVHHVEFAQTKPLPSYLIAFGVGPFELVPGGTTKSGVPVRIVTFKGHGGEAAYAAKTTARIVDLLEAWFQIPYPYPKVDILTIPVTAGFGAMENPGLVTYTQPLVLMDAKPSWQRRNEWISVASHELAHQWFGDYVTTAWWDDIWLNEGFANWMEDKIAAEFEPAWHQELHELTMRDKALRADSLTKARQIRQPIVESGDIFNVFDGITYDKGASILNMFERYVGSDVFARGVRDYLRARAFGNATSADFIAAISKASGKDLAAAFATFLDQPGEPEIAATLTCTGAPTLELAQRRYVPAGGPPPAATKPWIVPVCVAFDDRGKRREVCTLLDGPTGTLALPTKTCPRWVMPNVDARGYYRVHFTAPQATALRDEAWAELSQSERRGVFGDIEAGAQAPRPGFRDAAPEKLPLMLALSFVPKLLTSADRFTLEDALELPATIDRFVAADQRAKLEAWYRLTFAPGAQKLGLAPKDSDDFDTEASRANVVMAAAGLGRDPELVKQATAAAAHWRDIPEAMREPTLQIAIDGNPELVARTILELRAEPKRDLRSDMISALAGQRDPKGYGAALEVLLDPKLDLRETIPILTDTETEATRSLAEAFFRAHFAELMKRMPQDEVAGTLFGVVNLFMSACDPVRRDELVKEVTTRFGERPGAPHVIAEMTEALDHCIANRRALEPELRGWLGGLKIPRPPEPAKDAAKKKSKGR